MTAAQMAEQFLRHRRITVQFTEVMPEEHFDMKPWDGALSFGASALHLASAGDFYLSNADGGSPARPDPMPATPAEIRAYLVKKTAEQAERIGNLGDDLTRLVTVRTNEVPLWILLGQMREHEAHHKGQMMQMLRMAGNRDKLFYAVR